MGNRIEVFCVEMLSFTLDHIIRFGYLFWDRPNAVKINDICIRISTNNYIILPDVTKAVGEQDCHMLRRKKNCKFPEGRDPISLTISTVPGK